MNINKDKWLNTQKIRQGIVKVEPLKEGAISKFRCTYDNGVVCKEMASYTVHANYNKDDYQWVCEEHLLWGINAAKKYMGVSYTRKINPENYILKHQLSFRYIGFEEEDYKCDERVNNKNDGCWGYAPKWEITLVKMGELSTSDKDINHRVIVCNQHFKMGVKKLIMWNKGMR